MCSLRVRIETSTSGEAIHPSAAYSFPTVCLQYSPKANLAVARLHLLKRATTRLGRAFSGTCYLATKFLRFYGRAYIAYHRANRGWMRMWRRTVKINPHVLFKPETSPNQGKDYPN
ncbi:hypothetical protein P167DRAFT_568139 [Morchella conica CCBAS932]|uniref:Uncharacterized protein n=1 Tax=Morchella conica CCBAS932 TaxID=1392247 RepID=A0A3N4KFR9_9PEZI|nr:hypothetical protein P167DRAFT_568139 [Morchella conica CCBAS932]